MSGETSVARLAFALAPERQVEGQGDEAPLGHLRGVEIGALLLHRAHRMPDDDGRSLAHCGSSVFGREEIPRDVHLVLVLEGDLLQGHLVAGVEVVRAIGHVLSLCKRDVDERHHAERCGAQARELERITAAHIDAVLFGRAGCAFDLHDRLSSRL